MKIRNAKVYTAGHRFETADLYINDGRIVSDLGQEDKNVFDAKGLLAIPGLVDTHIHGAAGVDFSVADVSEIEKVARYEAEHGVTVIFPTTLTMTEDRLQRAMEQFRKYLDGDHEGVASIEGLHMEGPFFSKLHAGSQDISAMCAPDHGLFKKLQETSGGMIKRLSLAPELEGAMEFISAVHRDVRISIGHTDADYITANEAFVNGATGVTHLFNAMRGLHHRAPGPIAAAVECNAEAELIADGVHVHPAMVRLAFSLFPDDKIILISDSIMGTGLPDGFCSLAGRDIYMDGPLAVLADDRQTIAGSITNLFDCMKRAVTEMGIPLEKAVKAASENPARSMGIEADYGSLTPGHYADILLVDRRLELKYVFKRGKLLKTIPTEI